MEVGVGLWLQCVGRGKQEHQRNPGEDFSLQLKMANRDIFGV